MARIRTIKPEFWQSESVGRLSMGARLLFLACLNFADDEGLLRWNEAYLSSQAFGYDELNNEQLSEWMCELVHERIIFPYKSGSPQQRLAWIISFRTHQVINRPQPSKLPPPSIQNTEYRKALFERDRHICHLCKHQIDHGDAPNIVGSKAASIDHAIPKSDGGSDYPSNLKTAHISCNKSRKDKVLDEYMNDSMNRSMPEVEVEVEVERNGSGKGSSTRLRSLPRNTDGVVSEKQKKEVEASNEGTGRTWTLYSVAYEKRYGVSPVRNAKVNSILKQLVQRLGVEEAPAVAAFYLSHQGAMYVRRKHPVELLLADAEGLRTEWATGRTVTHTEAAQADRTQGTANVFAPLIAEAEERERLANGTK